MSKEPKLGNTSHNTLYGVFYPDCPSCEVALMIDGWCHHIDAPQNKFGNRRNYCGSLVAKGQCPLGGKP